MATSGNCPNCGSTLAPGATTCGRCGHKLTEAAPTEAPPGGPTFTKPSPAAGQSFDVSAALTKVRKRWGVEQSPMFMIALALGVAAFVLSTIFGPILIAAGDDAFERKLDAQVWLQLAFGLALGSAALAVLIRGLSGPIRSAGVPNVDLRAALFLSGATLIFCLFGLVKGLDGSSWAVDGWLRFATVYAVIVVALEAVSRPVPATLGTTNATTIGIVAIAGSGVALVIGLFMGMSNDNDTYVTGIALQQIGVVGMTLALGWFLGMQPRSG